MIFRKLMISSAVLVLMMALNACALFSKETKLEDTPPAVQETVNIEYTGDEAEEWGLETEDEDYLWMSLGSSQCVF
jgi:hypothetical protein